VARKGGLGKGLDSLIPETIKTSQPEKERIVEKVVEKIVEKPVELKVKISKVGPNKEQPRKQFDEDALVELSDSIRQFGIIQPLIVQEKNGFYEIIAGERRWRAAKLAGLKEVPVIVKKYTDIEVVEISLIENIQRESLNPIEEAVAYKRLLEEFHLKQDEVAERVSKSRTTVTNSMRLLKLDERVQQMVIDDMLTTGHARALLGIEDPELQATTAARVFDEKLSVREVEKIVKDIQKGKTEKKKETVVQDFIYTDLEEKMKAVIGSKVSINQKPKGNGKIEIEYYSKDDLERIIDLILNVSHT
jgi:ParB family chromosome partitioning protein